VRNLSNSSLPPPRNASVVAGEPMLSVQFGGHDEVALLRHFVSATAPAGSFAWPETARSARTCCAALFRQKWKRTGISWCMPHCFCWRCV